MFNGKSLVEFADFMSKYLSITFAQCHFENGEDVVENIQSLADWKSSFVILLIDEYYYPRREQFYGKLNNNHGLLVKEIVEGRGLLVIDSEEPDPYEVEWSVITPAVHPRCFRIESECFRSSIDIEEVSENFLNSLTPPRVYRQFGDSLSHHLELRDADHAFYLQGAVFCIAFQILPTVRMKKILVKELGRLRGMGESASVYGALEKVDTGWQELSICIMRMLVQRNCDPGVVALKLEEMAQREDILYTKMSGI